MLISRVRNIYSVWFPNDSKHRMHYLTSSLGDGLLGQAAGQPSAITRLCAALTLFTGEFSTHGWAGGLSFLLGRFFITL